MNDILKEFIEYYTSLEPLLNEACMKANKECDADALQAITNLHETAKFITMDFKSFDEILQDINKYITKKDEELT